VPAYYVAAASAVASEAQEAAPVSPRVVPKGWEGVQRSQRLDSGFLADPYRHMRTGEGVLPGDVVASWFRDRLLIAESQARAQAAIRSPVLRGRDQGDPNDPTADDGLDVAKERLRIAATLGVRELRDLSSSGNAFVPAGAAVYVAEEFSAAARARASLFNALRSRQLPAAGMKIEVPKFTGGAAVAVQSPENSAVQETDPTTGLASSNIAYVAGMVDASRQLFDFARPGFDQVLAADLGRALGVAVDQQLVSGTNANGQTEGLITVSGTIAVSYVDASPTVNKTVSKIWEAFRQIAEQGGGPPEPGADNYLVVMAPRRLAQLSANSGSTSSLSLPPLPGLAVATSGVRTTLGGGTED
jgi:HK97 family phage major capsid protein